jgi:hypothetical protein
MRRRGLFREIVKKDFVKKAGTKRNAAGRTVMDGILPRYDFSRAWCKKHASRYAAGSVVVVLEPDVAATFLTSKEVNEALRALAAIIKKHGSRKAESRPRL